MTGLVDLIIRDARIVSPETIVPADIVVDDGVIVAIGSTQLMPRARTTIDAGGRS